MHRIGTTLRAVSISATAMVALALASHPSLARDWMPPQVRATAEGMLSSLPDDWLTIKDVAAEKAIATGVPLVIDVREPAEFVVEHLARAKSIPLRSLLKNTEALPADKAAPIILYCKTGHRGAIALTTLRMVGYTDVRSISGGIDGWKAAGFPIAK